MQFGVVLTICNDLYREMIDKALCFFAFIPPNPLKFTHRVGLKSCQSERRL